MMRQIPATPRLLADDILVLTQGQHHEVLLHTALDATHLYIASIGGKIAPTKSYNFSTNRKTRQRLRTRKWHNINSTIPVITNTRDLGSHINTTHRMVAPTATARIHHATTTTLKIRHTSYSYIQKARLINLAAISSATYACEAMPLPHNSIQRLTTAITNTIAPPSKRASAAMVFATVDTTISTDPQAAILSKRVSTLRRIHDKHPHLRQTIQANYDAYQALGHKATKTQQLDIYNSHVTAVQEGFLKPFAHAFNATSTTGTTTTTWKFKHNYTKGPIGLLLDSVAKHGAAIDAAFTIHQHHEAPLHTITAPWQSLNSLTVAITKRLRLAHAGTTRTQLAHTPEIDSTILTSSLKQQTPDQRRWLTTVTNLGRWNDDTIHHINQDHDDMCQYCHNHLGTLERTIWQCPTFQRARATLPDGSPCPIHTIAWESLPPPLRLGIPPDERNHGTVCIILGTTGTLARRT